MSVLGSVGNFYVLLLILVLVTGTAVVAVTLARKYWDTVENYLDKKGGKSMNKWIKLAITSFVGIIIASFALGFVNSLSGGQDIHSAHGGSAAVNVPAYQAPGFVPVATQVPGYNNGLATGSLEAQIYNLQVNMMQMRQQLARITEMYMNRQMSTQGMPGGTGVGTNMGGAGSMSGTGNMGGNSASMGGMNMM